MLIVPNAVFDKFIEFLHEKDFLADVVTEYKNCCAIIWFPSGNVTCRIC